MSFENENNELLQYMLENKFYNKFRSEKQNLDTLELNITATCNQQCEYCYLVKHGTQIYPEELRKEDNIIQNTKMLIEYFIEQKIFPRKIDLFAGEIWGTKLSNTIFDILLSAIDKGWKIQNLMVPSNMTFLMDKKKTAYIEKYIEDFKKKGCRLTFSASLDGKLIEETARPLNLEKENEKKKTDSYYDNIFKWCKKYGFAFHPMVSAFTIEKWIDNYDWWHEMFRKYNLDPYISEMMLEVRNDEWTINKIEYFLKFVNHVIEYETEHYMRTTEEVVKQVIVVDKKERGYMPHILLDNGNGYNCSIDKSLIIRMGDLAIGPCHRTSYEKFIYGKYKVENGKITGVTANNVQLANLIWNGTTNGLIKCGNCAISRNCIRGCLGAQYESLGEILLPCDSVCQLEKAKLIFLYLKYKKMGVFEYVYKGNDIMKKLFLKKIEKDCNQLKIEEPNLWRYWECKVKELI